MNTDWTLIREMMNAAIDSCEKIEASGYRETDRARKVAIEGVNISLNEIVTSTWTYPELMRYQIIRQRHQKAADAPYVLEHARVLTAMAAACAELVGAKHIDPAGGDIKVMVDWYRSVAAPHVEKTLAAAA